MLPAGGSWMGWVLQLVETGTETRAPSVAVMEITRPNDLRDMASLGLTLPEAKPLLARVQKAVVAAQARDHAGLRPECTACGGRCHIKDWRPHQIATLFGGVTVRLPRFLCSGCGRSEPATSWPSALPVDPRAGPAASTSVRPHALSRRR